ncbi:DinB family protein [Lutibacter sp. HS1-25]|uniref:DinB family protein n=1 Tax=Lutibacter sp. HS1-25 TaxID=2485000 RepID=UPI0010118861|nr:DinB family protein [Lutibacter sp. HS1-25]RXP63525.1 DinB family protein [Lutibacter sp. HS1-25]
MIDAIEQNLNRGVQLLKNISEEEYRNTTIAPYYSSIGGHVRHILDVFDCVFEGLNSGNINLINRKRNLRVEQFTEEGIQYFEEIIEKLQQLNSEDFNKIVKVTDDLGLGVLTVDYTLGGILIQAHSHAIHHFASLGYIISQLGISLPDNDFGFNPTTPKQH